jgi:hypothetical protein
MAEQKTRSWKYKCVRTGVKNCLDRLKALPDVGRIWGDRIFRQRKERKKIPQV